MPLKSLSPPAPLPLLLLHEMTAPVPETDERRPIRERATATTAVTPNGGDDGDGASWLAASDWDDPSDVAVVYRDTDADGGCGHALRWRAGPLVDLRRCPMCQERVGMICDGLVASSGGGPTNKIVRFRFGPHVFQLSTAGGVTPRGVPDHGQVRPGILLLWGVGPPRRSPWRGGQPFGTGPDRAGPRSGRIEGPAQGEGLVSGGGGQAVQAIGIGTGDGRKSSSGDTVRPRSHPRRGNHLAAAAGDFSQGLARCSR